MHVRNQLMSKVFFFFFDLDKIQNHDSVISSVCTKIEAADKQHVCVFFFHVCICELQWNEWILFAADGYIEVHLKHGYIFLKDVSTLFTSEQINGILM